MTTRSRPEGSRRDGSQTGERGRSVVVDPLALACACPPACLPDPRLAAPAACRVSSGAVPVSLRGVKACLGPRPFPSRGTWCCGRAVRCVR